MTNGDATQMVGDVLWVFFAFLAMLCRQRRGVHTSLSMRRDVCDAARMHRVALHGY